MSIVGQKGSPYANSKSISDSRKPAMPHAASPLRRGTRVTNAAGKTAAITVHRRGK